MDPSTPEDDQDRRKRVKVVHLTEEQTKTCDAMSKSLKSRAEKIVQQMEMSIIENSRKKKSGDSTLSSSAMNFGASSWIKSSGIDQPPPHDQFFKVPPKVGSNMQPCISYQKYFGLTVQRQWTFLGYLIMDKCAVKDDGTDGDVVERHIFGGASLNTIQGQLYVNGRLVPQNPTAEFMNDNTTPGGEKSGKGKSQVKFSDKVEVHEARPVSVTEETPVKEVEKASMPTYKIDKCSICNMLNISFAPLCGGYDDNVPGFPEYHRMSYCLSCLKKQESCPFCKKKITKIIGLVSFV